ncbi:MAG: hypothetical protein COB42_00850 [Sulfurimonas sp.]|nr:MAG: hypothetical protein COB42_00850 [Sulfurimonas sp.]
MLYKIQAKYKKERLKDFFSKLTDGSIESLKPDGTEILHSMKNAKISSDNIIVWYESCFCEIPLNHERTTVYDKYFDAFIPDLVERRKDDIVGKSFWEYMRTL